MATKMVEKPYGGSFLVELASCAGWQLEARNGNVQTIRARRAGTELEASGASLADAAGSIFARALQSSRRLPEG